LATDEAAAAGDQVLLDVVDRLVEVDDRPGLALRMEARGPRVEGAGGMKQLPTQGRRQEAEEAGAVDRRP
jgi:hypothetical protein